MKKVVGYVKRPCSEEEEARQRHAIETYCAVSGYDLAEWIEYDDFGPVAYGNWIGHRKIDAVVAASNMDVTENVFEFWTYRCKMQLRGSGLYVAEWKDYPGYGMHRRVIEELISTMCRKELEYEPVRNADGRKRKARKGQYIGGNAPMGYKVVDGRLLVNEAEVPTVLFIMEEKHAGRTKVGTVEKLNAGGYRNRRGGKFTIGTVQGIWNNEEFYKGYYRIKDTGEWVKGQHEAILKD